MSKDDSLRDLIERVEKAEGPDRELDARIAEAAGWRVLYDKGNLLDKEPYYQPDPDISWRAVLRYTASVDSAMSLVPEGWWHGYMTSEGGFDAHCFEQVVDSAIFRATAATPALALCCASLRAHMGTGG